MGGLLGGTSYGNGSRTTTTNIGPVPTTVPAGANMEGIYDLFRRMTQARTPEASSTPLLGGVSRMPARGNPLNRATESYDPLASLQREAQAQQIQQSMAPPPMRMTTFGPGSNNAYMPDVNAMTAFQRQLFLPKESEVPEGESRRLAIEEEREAKANAEAYNRLKPSQTPGRYW